MNMASKDKYKSLLERYKQALIKNPKLNLSAFFVRPLRAAALPNAQFYAKAIFVMGRL
jgi:hypothetical protein